MQTYKPSGQFSLATIPYTIVIGGIGAIASAWIYQWLIDLLPYWIVVVIAAFLFGGLMGAAIGMGLNAGRCRNAALGLLLTIIVGAIGVVASHEFARSHFNDEIAMAHESEEEIDQDSAQALASEVSELSWGEYLDWRSEIGYSFSRRGRESTMTGGVVWALWGIEALFVIIFTAFIAFDVGFEPFCEASGEYCKQEKLGTLADVDPMATIDAVMQDGVAGIVEPPRAQASGATIEYRVYLSPNGQGPNYLSAKLKYKNGKKDESKDIVKEAIISAPELQVLHATLNLGSGHVPDDNMPSNPDAFDSVDLRP
ncbi:MAG: hypothetical protein KDB07_03875 [Planctomycetes bacterium]|nr:hypothetical protein [Planctomycetota bacterium]